MVATPTILSIAEARQLVEIVEEGGAYSKDVRPEIERALFSKGLIEGCEDRDFWLATDAGWDAYPKALRQVGEDPRRQRWTWRWHPAAQRLLGFLPR
jgi:hypothetical protein